MAPLLELVATLQKQHHWKLAARIRVQVHRGMSSSTKKEASAISAITINNPKELYREGESQPDKEEGLNEVEIYTRKMRDIDPNLVYASTLLPDAAPKLPENPAEIAALDPAMDTWEAGQYYDRTKDRIVHIKQVSSRSSQSPKGNEMEWKISFEDEGELAHKWKNPLMGWKSGADPMHNMTLQLTFDSAKEAVYFAKVRGWKYVVEEPKLRTMRSDGATYQDNFLPKFVAAKVIKDGIKCDHWARTKAGASHYFRPLKYHGDGYVTQYGPNPDAPIAPECPSYYKMR